MKQKPKNILVLTYFSFADALIQTYTLPYVYQIAECIQPGGKAFLFTLEKKHQKYDAEEIRKIKENLLKHHIHWTPHTYHPWGLKAMISWIGLMIKLFVFTWKNKITQIHGWATPGGAAGYLLSMMTGKPLIIDSYEPHAEAMVENGSWKKGSNAHRILFFLEKLQTKKAKYLIASNRKMNEYALARYGKFSAPMFEKPACTNLELFSFKNRKKAHLVDSLGLSDKIVCVYAGKFGGIYLEQEVFDFFAVAHKHWGDKLRILLLTNQKDEEIKAYCEKSNLDHQIIKREFVPHQEVPDYMGLGDFAITPVKPVFTKRFCTPIKDGEYWALGLPVIITKNISSDSDTIENEKIGYVLKDLTTAEYQNSVEEIDRLLQEKDIHIRIREIADRERNFSISMNVYNQVYGQ